MYSFCQIFYALYIFEALCLFFLANFTVSTFLPCPTSIPDSRIIDSEKVWCFENFENYLILCIIRISFFFYVNTFVFHYTMRNIVSFLSWKISINFYLFSAICNDNAVEFEVLDQIAELEEILTLNMISAKVSFFHQCSDQ